ncbi:MAG TPA: F0F1 ATP synthase subunit B [Candidatus Xenobia bacterium]|jgi:F-type H+-transporting ATPase subunit b
MEITPLTVIVQIFNFYILYNFVLRPLVFKPLQQAMADREATVKKSLDDAATAAKEAQHLKQQYESRLNEAKQEATGIVTNSQKEGDRIKNELVESGRKEAQRLLDKANTEIRAERERAMSELRSHVANLSVAMAKQLLVDNLDADAQQQIVQKMLKAGASHGA